MIRKPDSATAMAHAENCAAGYTRHHYRQLMLRLVTESSERCKQIPLGLLSVCHQVPQMGDLTCEANI